MPLGMALLVATKGEAGLPLGRLAWLGTGEARLGGAEGAAVPLGEAAKRVLVVAMLTCVTVMSVLVGEMTWPALAVPVLWMTGVLLAVMPVSIVLVVRVDFDETDMACYSMPPCAHHVILQ